MDLENVDLKEDERIDSLFEQDLYVIQSKSVFSFSLDARLLADFTRLPQKPRAKIIDLCAGNGAVTMMLSAKTDNPIYGIEIQDRLVDMARRSVHLNHLEDQVTMIHGDLAHAPDHFDHDSIEVITCNPPYFKDIKSSRKNQNDHYTIARHEIATNLKEIVQTSAYLLKTKGKFYMVHRPERFLEIIDTLRAYRLLPKRVRFVHPKADKAANMVLIEAIKNGNSDGFIMEQPLIIFDQKDQYLAEVRKMIYGDQ